MVLQICAAYGESAITKGLSPYRGMLPPPIASLGHPPHKCGGRGASRSFGKRSAQRLGTRVYEGAVMGWLKAIP